MIILRRWHGNLVVVATLLGCGEMDRGAGADSEEVSVVRSSLTTTTNQSLVITDLAVTRDPDRIGDPCSMVAGDEDTKEWTVAHLLKREAVKNGISPPSNYASGWMNAWTGNVVINGQTVPPLTGPGVRLAWNRFAGGSTALPLHKAPFWLLAIVSRLDLRKYRPLGEPLGGEVRFVFGILGANGNNPACPTNVASPVSTVIFEYSPAKADENQVRDFARRWLDLSNMSGSTYRSSLQTLTEEVVNNGRLLRIRTNEGPDSKTGGTLSGWDMGEFEANATTKLMQRSTIKQSPTMALSDGTSQLMADWIWANRDPLFANAFDYEIGRVGSKTVTDVPIGSYSVPNTFPGTSTWFRGSLNGLTGNNDFWNTPGATGVDVITQTSEWNEALFRFSVGTCRGCHGQDTGTTSFLHIHPGPGPGMEAGRSPFMQGRVDFPDPRTGQSRQLDELFRRENDLRALVNGDPVLVPVFGNNYTVRFRNSGKCMDSAGNTTTDGAFSQLFTCHGNGNQRLALVSAGAGVYNLKYKHSGKCVDIQGGSTTNGARVIQATCNGSRPSQRFMLDTLIRAAGTIPNPRVLRFQHSNLCLLVQNQATADGTAIIQGTCPSTTDLAKGFDLVE